MKLFCSLKTNEWGGRRKNYILKELKRTKCICSLLKVSTLQSVHGNLGGKFRIGSNFFPVAEARHPRTWVSAVVVLYPSSVCNIRNGSYPMRWWRLLLEQWHAFMTAGTAAISVWEALDWCLRLQTWPPCAESIMHDLSMYQISLERLGQIKISILFWHCTSSTGRKWVSDAREQVHSWCFMSQTWAMLIYYFS